MNIDEPRIAAKPRPVVGALGIAAAAVLISILISIAMGALTLLPFVLVVTLTLSLLFGFPVFLFLREGPRANWLTIGGGGFLTGAIIPALLLLPRPGADQASVGGVATVIDGHYTAAGWAGALEIISAFGAAGIIGAWVAWGLIAWAAGSEAIQRKRRLALGGLVIAAIAGASILPWATMDRSCHNSLRDGRRSIGSIAEFELHLPMAEWTELRSELQTFADTRGWDFRADVRPDPGFPWFQASLCTEPGTLIVAQHVPLDGGYVVIGAYQPQGGDSWRVPLRALQDRVAARWPGRIVYPSGEYAAPKPPWPLRPASVTPKPSSTAR